MASDGSIAVTVRTFNDAGTVGDAYRDGNIVELVVQDADLAVARRVVDFATGLVYGDRGSMYRVEETRYRLVPASRASEK